MRRYLTPREKLAMLQAQGWLCACGCHRPVWPGGPVEYDHHVPVALGNTAKPDRALAPFCHRLKTKRDVGMISKADRQRFKAERVAEVEMMQKIFKRKMQSRGFTQWRGMDGSIRRKTDER